MIETCSTTIIPCPICGSTTRRQLHTPGAYRTSDLTHFNLSRCLACGLVYLCPRPTEETLEQYYGAQYYTSANASAGSDKTTEHAKRYKAHVGRACSLKTGRLLDVGCGDGEFLQLMAESGWECHGVEPHSDTRKIIENRSGIRSVVSSLSEVETDGFDCITLFEVIEHLVNPVEDLRFCRNLLKPGGVLIIKTPNVKSFEYCVLGPNWISLEIPRHLLFFSKNTLISCLSQAGLKTNRVSFPSNDQALARSVWLMMSGRGAAAASVDAEYTPKSWRRTADRFISASLMPLWWLLSGLGLGHTMLAYAYPTEEESEGSYGAR